ncbi:MAG: MucB/RseB C-terminal domain-containing protein [Pseudomonadales bacterium]|nr:MucB/RseB C-terminal domain-containing protein [Pseudomonadales bacterium]
MNHVPTSKTLTVNRSAMTRGLFRWLPLFALSLAMNPVRADDEASVWLDKMGKALREQNYQGIFTYMRGHQFDTVEVIHRFRDGQESERLAHLNGEPREVVRDGDEVICIHARTDQPDFDHNALRGPFTHAFNQNLATYQEFYNFNMKGTDRIAGRQAVTIDITPKNNDRYGYRLWLDEDSGLLLQSHLINRGRVLEVFQFSRVEIGEPIEDQALASSLGDDVIEHSLTSPVIAQADAVKPQWKVSWLPRGFRPVRSDAPDRISFTDGIATISVFVEKSANSNLGEVATKMGGTVVISRRLQKSSQQITVVGEVPMDTAKKIAESVEPVIY